FAVLLFFGLAQLSTHDFLLLPSISPSETGFWSLNISWRAQSSPRHASALNRPLFLHFCTAPPTALAGRYLPISELGNPCESLHQRPFSEGGKGPSWGRFSVDPSEKGNFGNLGF
ncbi:hypothetical protein, partial [Pseudomonas aeruginosa]|uniref:hypothetical protein n=1 Tax=Pseudomonas aeruginosa TaxID=287 RepID=UPI001EE713D9